MPLVQLDSQYWDSLLRSVDEWLPNSLVVYHWLKIACTRMAPTLDGASCYVDRWPCPDYVACIDPITYESCPRSCFLSFAMRDETDESGFLRFLADLDSNLHLTTPSVHAVCGLSLPLRLSQAYCSYFRDRQCWVKYYENDAYWVSPDAHRSLLYDHVDPPAGFYFDTLRLDEAELVDETWPHRWMGSLPLNIRKVRYMPNVCLRRSADDALSSFEIMHSEFGLINHLYTRPQFRRQGLARVVELRQMKNSLQAGMIPYKLVVCEKEAPVKLTEQIGYWTKYGQYPFVEIFTPEAMKFLNSSDGSEESSD